jgi:hypothetical protein
MLTENIQRQGSSAIVPLLAMSVEQTNTSTIVPHKRSGEHLDGSNIKRQKNDCVEGQLTQQGMTDASTFSM